MCACADLLDSLLAMQYQNVKMKSAMRVTRVDIPSSGAAGEMALHIPVSLQAGELQIVFFPCIFFFFGVGRLEEHFF